MRNSRYIIWVGATLVLLLVLFVIYRAGLSHSGSSSSAPLSLNSYNQSDAQVQLTIKGPVTANERYTSRTITVDSTDRVFEADATYATTPLINQDDPNNQPAFADFLAALQRDGFTKTRHTSSGSDQGACPTGERFEYKLVEDQKILLQTWTTTCDSTPGSFGGSSELVNNLFESQVLNYEGLVESAAATQAATVKAAETAAASSAVTTTAP